MAGTLDGHCCGVCGQRFYHPSLNYCCNNGHSFCRACFQEEQEEDQGPRCPYRRCKSHVYRMDRQAQFRECNQSKGNKIFFDRNVEDDTTKMFAPTSKRRIIAPLLVEKYAIDCFRPVNCPYPGCNKAVAVASFSSHFKYEHKMVASIGTPYDTRNGLEFNPYFIRDHPVMCIVLLNVIDDVDRTSPPAGDDSDATGTRPVMLAMMQGIQFSNNEDEEDLADDEIESFPFEKVIFWVSSSFSTKTKYTIAACTICKSLRFKYFGPVSHVNECGYELCESGKGLILHQTHMARMTRNGKIPLSLDVVLHNEQ